MRNKIKLLMPDGDVRKVQEAFDYGEVDGSCPHCKGTPFRVQGRGRRIAADDRAYEADGECTSCDKYVGIIRAEVSTLFGLREDEAVSRFGVRIF